MYLVTDIGGTNTRLALVDETTGRLQCHASYKNAQFQSYQAILEAYLDTQNSLELSRIVIAVAAPIYANRGQMTNLPWLIDGPALSERFGGIPVRVVNDLTAMGFAALALNDDQVTTLYQPSVVARGAQRQALVVGIGTGINVSPVVVAQAHTSCLAVEAGHLGLPSSLYAHLQQLPAAEAFEFNTLEDLFSGRGRRAFLSAYTGTPVSHATPYIEAYGAGQNRPFDLALDAYAQLIGLLLLELKSCFLPFDGIFLAGGVARSSLLGMRAALCLAVLNRDEQFLQTEVPVWMIDDDAAALTGCAIIAKRYINE